LKENKGLRATKRLNATALVQRNILPRKMQKKREMELSRVNASVMIGRWRHHF
jgi:hypothetical protein